MGHTKPVDIGIFVLYIIEIPKFMRCQGIKSFQEQRLDQLDAKCQARKNRSVNPTAAIACPMCGHICASQFRLCSHQKRH